MCKVLGRRQQVRVAPVAPPPTSEGDGGACAAAADPPGAHTSRRLSAPDHRHPAWNENQKPEVEIKVHVTTSAKHHKNVRQIKPVCPEKLQKTPRCKSSRFLSLKLFFSLPVAYKLKGERKESMEVLWEPKANQKQPELKRFFFLFPFSVS